MSLRNQNGTSDGATAPVEALARLCTGELEARSSQGKMMKYLGTLSAALGMALSLAMVAACGSPSDGELQTFVSDAPDDLTTRKLRVYSLEPDEGALAGNTLVGMTGTGFEPDMEVMFGDRQARGVFVGGDQLAILRSPEGLEPGPVDVTIKVTDGRTLTITNGFSYVEPVDVIPKLEVISVTPSSGPESGGNIVVIEGRGFTESTTIAFGQEFGVACDTISASAITCDAPRAVGPGIVDVHAENPELPGRPAESAVKLNAYEYLPDATVNQNELIVLGAIPASGPLSGGGTVTIKGQGFVPGVLIFFGESLASCEPPLGEAAVVCTLPPGDEIGAVDVRAENPSQDGVAGQTSRLNNGFTYEDDSVAALPLLATRVNPSNGPLTGGTLVAISGQGFEPGTTVTFGDAPATEVVALGGEALTCITPAGVQAGATAVTVTLPGGEAYTLPDAFSYIDTFEQPDALLVLSAIPNSGPLSGGGFITLAGQGFTAGASVTFGTVPATTVNVLGPNAMAITVPAGVAPGLVDITVELTNGDMHTLVAGYNYIDDTITPDTLLVLNSIPGAGPLSGGNTVTLAGQGFGPGMTVFFAGTEADQCIRLGTTAMTCLAPPALTPGFVDIRAQLPNNDFYVLPSGYEYLDDTVAADDLVVSSLIPTESDVAGGDILTLSGQGMVAGATVTVGGTAATNVAVFGSTAITATIPPGTVGTVDVVVTNPNGASVTLPSVFTYTEDDPQTAASLLVLRAIPNKGPVEGTNIVALEGTGFDGTSVVSVDGVVASNINLLGPTALTFEVPAGTSPSFVDITVQGAGQSHTLANAYEYVGTVVDSTLLVLDVLPDQGSILGGNFVAISGNGFEDGANVLFDGVAATGVTVLGSNTITAIAPAGAAGATDVRVVLPGTGTTPGDAATLAGAYTYVDDVPQPDALLVLDAIPDSGSLSGGEVVTISGTGFAPGMVFYFDGVAGSDVTFLAPTVVTVKTPGTATVGMVDVKGELPSGDSHTLVNGYRYYDDGTGIGALGLVAVIPSEGPLSGGTTVTLTGGGFVAGTTVFVGTALCDQVTVLADTALTCQMPPGTVAGLADIRVELPNGDSVARPGIYTYIDDTILPDDLLAVEAIPAVGPLTGGNTVTVAGQGFEPGMTVTIGGSVCTQVQVLGSYAVTCLAPQGVAPGAVDVRVELPSGVNHTIPGAYSYFDNSVAPDPLRILQTLPSSGSVVGGNSLTIEGTGFTLDTKVTVGGLACNNVNVLGTTAITCTAPAGATAGPVDVTVYDDVPNGDSDTLVNGYTYDAAQNAQLSVAAIVPASGSEDGGNLVVLSGAGFAPGMTVTFGGTASPSVSVLSSSSATAVTPASAAGVTDVVLTNPDASQATLAAAFEFVPETVNMLVLSAIPDTGPLAGGGSVTIAGQGFEPGATVQIDGANCTAVGYLGPNALTCTVPTGTAVGFADISVTNPAAGGNAAATHTLVDGYNYRPVSLTALSLATVYPVSGNEAGGDLVLLTGTGFDNAMVVEFGGVASGSVQYLTPNSATALTPPHTPGLVDVTIINPDSSQDTLANGYAYLADSTVAPDDLPAIGAVLPGIGPVAGGTTIQILGEHFTAGSSVTIAGVAASDIKVLSQNLITATVPAGTAGPASVTVTDIAGQSDTLVNGFTYADPTTSPVIAALWPVSGPHTGGTWVVIDGTNFQSSATAFFDGVPAVDTQFVGPNRLIAVSPAGSVGSVDVDVVNPDGGWDDAVNGFAYYDAANLPSSPPVVASVFPEVGTVDGGTSVSLLGSNFQPGARVFFGATEAVVNAEPSASDRDVTTPAHAAGATAVTIVNPDGLTHSLGNSYVYFTPPPLVSGVQPDTGSTTGGYAVTVVGKNFRSDTVLQWGTATISSFNSQTPTALTFFAPPAAAGAIDVRAANADGQADTALSAFTYVDAASLNTPVITSIDPATGPSPGGYIAIIHGQNFQPTASVSFGVDPATSVTVLSSTALQVTVPPGTANAIVDIHVDNAPGSSATLADGFTYGSATNTPLSVRSVSPGVGPTTGGTVVTISGNGFTPGTAVSFGATASTIVDVISTTTMTAVAPPGAAGLVNVRVDRPDMQTETAANAFAYYAPSTFGQGPSVLSIDPIVGPLAGSALVLIKGQQFTDPATVYFGANQAPSVNVVDASTIVARTPAGLAVGTVAVSVTNNDGLVDVLPGAYSYYDATGMNPPVVTSAQPGLGSTFGGDQVTVSGDLFSSGARVFICDRPATVLSLSGDDTLTVLTPPNTPGACTIAVVNSNGLTGQRAQLFEYTSPTPEVTTVTPSVGPIVGGLDVVIQGSNFVPGATVRFGNATATSVVVSDPNTLACRTPPNVLGLTDVTVINPGAAQPQDTLTDGFTYVDAVVGTPPTVTAIVPPAGPLAGGTPVQVFGTGFHPNAALLFDGAQPSTLQWTSASELRFTTPPRTSAGPVTLTVLNPDGLGATVPMAFTYVPPSAPAPTITSVVPAIGPEGGGNTITITGSGFTATGSWFLDGTPLLTAATVSSTLVTAQAPANNPGLVDILYVGPDGQVASKVDAYEYLAAPGLTSLQPNLGGVAGGTQLTAIGDNFEVGMQIWFGATQGDVLVVSSSSTATVQTPSRAAHGFVDVRIVNPDGQSDTLVDGFEYLAVPELTSVWPPTGPNTGGTLVEIDGSGLHVGSKIFFGPNEATAVYFSSFNRVYARTPVATITTVDVRVINPDGGQFTLPGSFTYVDPATLGATPFISDIFPARGPATGGTHVAIDGLNFDDGARAILLPNRATLNSVRGDRIVAVAPAHPIGMSEVWVVNPDGQTVRSPTDFEYLDPATVGPAPTITGFTPVTGPTAGNTDVTVLGTDFQTGAVIRFGDRDATEVTNTANQIETKTPANASGTVSVWLINPDGTQAQAPVTYRYIPPPNITSVSPSQGPASGGTSVTIFGTDLFSDPAGVKPSVLFCTDYATSQGCVTADPTEVSPVTNGTEISVETPMHTAGLVDVVVVSPDGQLDTKIDSFTFTVVPSVTSIAPDAGPTAGGTTITVTGTGFQPGVAVMVDLMPCGSVNLASATQLTCVTPAGTSGPADVIVTNSDGGSVTEADGFTYLPAPFVDRVVPDVGPNAGGITATVQGLNFTQTPLPRVFFGTVEVPAADINVLSSSAIQLTVPAGAGSVDVKVRNPDLQEGFKTDGFVYIPPLPTPVITYVTPPSGDALGGETIKVVGMNFLTGATAFVGDEATSTWSPITQIDIRNNGTVLVGLTPTMAPGLYDVRVVNTDGQDVVINDAYTFVPPPADLPLTLIAIDPARSIVAGGDYVTISGTGFRQGMTVRFGVGPGSQFSPEVTRFGPTLLRAKVPSAPNNLPGSVTVRLTNPPTATSAAEVYEAADAFEYVVGAVFVVDPGDRLFNEARLDRGALIFDADGDGLNDVLVFTDDIDRLVMNGRDGKEASFTSRTFAPNSGNVATDQAGAHDFDGDGDLDIIRESRSAQIQYCENLGGGDFPSCVTIRNHNSYCDLSDLVIEDLNCDGFKDILLVFSGTHSSCRTSALMGYGGSSFRSVTSPFPPELEPTRGVAADDVDGDGDIDLIMSNDSNVQNRLYLNNCADLQIGGQCTLPLPGYTGGITNGKAYTRTPSTMLYDDAKTWCTDRGMTMAVVDDGALDTYLNSLSTSSFWIQQRRPASNQPHVWDPALPATSSTYSNWCTNEPNTGSYHYAYSNSSNCWVDIYNWSGAYGFCEHPGTACSSLWAFSNGQYGTGKNFPITGGNTRDSLLVDIDDDGDKDAIIANYQQQTLVFMNVDNKFVSDDQLRWPQNETNKNFSQVRAVDIDLDGDMDIIATLAGNEVKIYVNDRYTIVNGVTVNGIGAYTDRTSECDANGVCRWPNADGTDSRTDITGMTVGDLDNDDLPDVYLVGRSYSDRLIMNNGFEDSLPWIDTSRVGEGFFRHNAYRTFPERRDNTLTIKVGDVDGDGKMDIVKTGYDDPISVYVNDGAGKLIDVSSTTLPTETYPLFRATRHAHELADIDGDGDLDIIFEGAIRTSGSPGSSYPAEMRPHRRRQLINDGFGNFTDTSATNQPSSVPAGGSGILVEDLDMDGDLDIMVGNEYSNTQSRLYLNGGDVWNVGGAFFFDETSDWRINIDYINYRYTRGFYPFDLDGNAYPDIIVARNGVNRIWKNVDGTRFDDVTIDFGNSSSDDTRHIIAADFDNDGDKDLISVNYNANRYHLRDTANGFSDITATAYVGSRNSTDGAAGDFDCDGLLDFYIANYEGQNDMFHNLGGSGFLQTTDNLPWDVHRSQTMELVDWDGDGDLDVLVGNQNDQDRLYINTMDDPSDIGGGLCPDPVP